MLKSFTVKRAHGALQCVEDVRDRHAERHRLLEIHLDEELRHRRAEEGVYALELRVFRQCGGKSLDHCASRRASESARACTYTSNPPAVPRPRIAGD